MVRGGHAPAGERAVQRVAGALAFLDGDELLLVLLEAAQDCIGVLSCTSTRRARERVKVSGDSAGPVPERWELWELWEL